MMTLRLGTYSLFLAVILWGTLLGGIAYSHLVYFPVYLSALPDSSVVVNGTYGLNEGIFWMMIHPLLILSLILTLVLNWKFKSRRKLILISLAIYIVVLIVTQIYFLPELGAFRHSPESNLSPAEWLARGQRWQRLSWIRGVTMYIGILPLLLALTKPDSITKESVTAAAI
ncbi:MAG TPA: hypothetical protein VGX92_03595 [Pyrinomonadaceae bacterium]|jgi:hypothetical protein|nr:hypothetical protein [Pyrinomonadaceae bacterium]